MRVSIISKVACEVHRLDDVDRVPSHKSTIKHLLNRSGLEHANGHGSISLDTEDFADLANSQRRIHESDQHIIDWQGRFIVGLTEAVAVPVTWLSDGIFGPASFGYFYKLAHNCCSPQASVAGVFAAIQPVQSELS